MKPRVLLVFQTRLEECKAMLRGIAQHFRERQCWDVFLDEEGQTETNPGWLYEKKWHGVISRHTSPVLVEACAKMHLPLVDLSDSPPVPGVSKVRADNISIGHMGAEHLLGLGFSRFGYCGYKNLASSIERRNGFLEAVNLARQRADVFEIGPHKPNPEEEGQQALALAGWLRRLPGQVGIMTCNDRLARDLIQAALAARLAVPEDVAVCGANNEILHCELFGPSITSVAPNFFEAGHKAAGHLDGLISGETRAPIDLRIEPLEVVGRESTDILQFREKNVALALKFIQAHACRGIRVDDILAKVPVSRSQLESKFRRFVGRSPQAEIRRVQVSFICRLLLEEKDWPLKKIAEETGFDHTEYMHVIFKRLMGETPGQYRGNLLAQERLRATA